MYCYCYDCKHFNTDGNHWFIFKFLGIEAAFDTRGINWETRTPLDIDGFYITGVHSVTGNLFGPNGFNRECIHKDTGTRFGPDGYKKNGCDARGFFRSGIHKDTGTRFGPDGLNHRGHTHKQAETFARRLPLLLANLNGPNHSLLRFWEQERQRKAGLL